MAADFDAEIQTAVADLRHAYESTLESAIGRCMLLGFTPDRVHVEQGHPMGSEAHPVTVLDKQGTVLASIWVHDDLEAQQIQVVRVFSDAVLAKVHARLGAAEG